MSTQEPREHAQEGAPEAPSGVDSSVEPSSLVDMSLERDVETGAGLVVGAPARSDADPASDADTVGPADSGAERGAEEGAVEGAEGGEGSRDEAGEQAAARADAGAAPEADVHGGLGDPDLPPLATVLEAILLVTDVPVPAITLAQVVERPTGEVEGVLADLARGYDEQGRGFELRQVAGGWRLYTRAECAPFVERFVLDGQQARLTQAALETLAVIAYRQPVTRQRVSAVRGVNVDGVVRTLVARGLITEAGTDEDTGATRYQTTSYFLERLGLQSLEDLPSLAPLLPELEDIADDSVSG